MDNSIENNDSKTDINCNSDNFLANCQDKIDMLDGTKEINYSNTNINYEDYAACNINSIKDCYKKLDKRYQIGVNKIKNEKANESLTKRQQDSQQKEIKKNKDKINFLKNDIMTVRKQLMISENEHKKKSFYVFFLKIIYIFLIIISTIILLVRNDIINVSLGNKLQIVSIVITLLIIGLNVFLRRYRHNNIFSKQNWELDLDKPKNEIINPV